jgi:hypothetical protein
VTVACGGSDVFNKSGGGTTATLTLLNQALVMQYASGVWIVHSTDVPAVRARQDFARHGR